MIFLIFLQNAFLALNRGSFLDPDLGWRLRLGKYMTETGTLPTKFIGYNYFKDLNFVDHQWLSNLIVYKLYNQFGYVSLVILSALILFISSILLYRLCLKRSGSMLLSFFGVSLFLISIYNSYYGFRLQYLLYLFLALILFFNQFIIDKNIKTVLYVVLFVLGSNLHGGGMLFFLPIVALLECNHLKSFPLNLKELWKGLKHPGLLIFVLLAAMSINPYGLGFWKTMGDYILDPYYKDHIGEWLPLVSIPLNWSSLIIYALLIFLLTVEKNWKKLPISRIILLASVGYMAYFSKRTLPVFVMLALPDITSMLRDGFKSISLKAQSYIAGIFFVFQVIVMLFFGLRILKIPARDPFIIQGVYPIKAIEFLSKEEPGLVYNLYRWGGFISWKYPSIEVFIDGRSPQTKYQNKTILQLFNEIESEKDFEKYGIKYLVTDKLNKYECSPFDKLVLLAKCHETTSFNERIASLSDDNLIDRIYEDDLAVIYRTK